MKSEGTVLEYHYRDMYTEAYYRQALEQVEPDADRVFEKGTYWESFDDRRLVGLIARRLAVSHPEGEASSEA